MEPALFPPEFFRALERIARRGPERGPGAAARPRPGRSRMGYQHRPYAVGDELRRMDWRATARAGRPQVRVPEEEVGGEHWLLLDRSASLAPVGTRRDLDQRRLALALGWLALERGGVATLVAGDGPLQRYEGSARRPALQAALAALPPPAGADHPPAEALPAHGTHARACFLSDPWCSEPWWRLLRALRPRVEELTIVALILPEEDDPPAEALRLQAVEDGGQRLADLRGGRPAFRRAWRARLAGLAARAAELGARWCELRSGGPLDPASAVLQRAEERGLV